MSDPFALHGSVQTWSLGEHRRRYLVVTMPFAQARLLTKAYPFSAATGEGEQRREQAAHVRRLREEMETGRYSPTPLAAGLRQVHRSTLVETDGGAQRGGRPPAPADAIVKAPAIG